jgi:precorrin-3B C17-methyltransferase
MTAEAERAIKEAEVIVGYKSYIDTIKPIIKKNTQVLSGSMGQEVQRARIAIDNALQNKKVVVVSSGDPGVYGMAGVVIESAWHAGVHVPIEIVPGVTAATAAAAALGAPLVGDFAVVSLSDILTSWEKVERRLKAAAESDFVIVLYNPQSSGRREPLAKAHKILLEHRSPVTPVGIVKKARRIDEEVVITTLKEMLCHSIDMSTTLIIGNSTTYVADGKMVTPRGYHFSGVRQRGK